MSIPDPLLVLDSSVAFDLINGGLIRGVKSLPFEFAVPDIIYVQEFNEEAKGEITKLVIQILEFDSIQVAEVNRLGLTNTKPSMSDLFAFVAARDLQAILLTGDGALRELAVVNGISVHGTLWVLDELVTQKIIKPENATIALRNILAKGSYLPQVECINRFLTWGEKEDFWDRLF